MYSTKFVGIIAVASLLTLGAGCGDYFNVSFDFDESASSITAPIADANNPAPAPVPTPTPSAPAATTKPGTTVTAPVSSGKTVSFKSIGDSKVTGSATFTKVKDGLRVAVALKNSNTGSAYSVNIESGSCTGRGEVNYPLNNAIKGSSVTILNDLTMEHIFTKDKVLSIKVKPTEASLYVACADIR